MHHLLKKTTAVIMLCLLILPLLWPGRLAAQGAFNADLELEAVSAILVETESGRVLYAKAAEEKVYPASLTKIMTLLVAMEEFKKGRVEWDTLITASKRAWETRGSTMFLNIGQQATFREMMRGIAIVSANDACVAVAEHLYGSEAAFVQQMNRRAKELGMEKTHFANAHGLHNPDHYTTAHDLARLAAYFIKTQPEAAAFQAEKDFTFNEITQHNINPLLGNFPGADGIKTGYTPEAGYCLAASSKQDGLRLISVVLGCSGDDMRKQDSAVLLNYGFRNFELAEAAAPGETVVSLPVSRGVQRQVNLTVTAPLTALVPRGEAEQLEITVEAPDKLTAPLEKGAVVGTVRAVYNGETIAEGELAVAEPVERLGFFPSLWRSITDFFSGLWQRVLSKDKAPEEAPSTE